MTTRLKKLAISVTACVLAACGGGGGSDSGPSTTTPSLPSFEGAFEGNINGTASSAFQLLALEDGTVWSIYGNITAGTFFVNGFIQGTVTTTAAGGFRATDTKDFGFAPAVAGTMDGTYTSSLNFNGTFVSSGRTTTISGKPISTGYTYATAATADAMAGSWRVALGDGEVANLTISAPGVLTGLTSLGCSFTGTVVPRPSGKNVYNATVNFGAAPCALPGQRATGVGVISTLSNGQKQLLVALVDPTRTYGTFGYGVR